MNPGSDSFIPDDVFALRIQQLLMATPAQLESARAFQADCAREGKPLPLADALVKLGIVTLAQRDTVEQRLRAEQKTGLARLLHYKLLRKIGEGAMGAVYLAEDERDKRQVALKVLPRSAAARPGFVERFQREADAAGRLRHPNIVHAFSSGDDQGWYFFVMEYCDGETQDKRLKRERVLPPEEATAVILQIARALQYAHGQGVVHRDVKPSNIILAPDGTAKILDLGLSKNVHEAEAAFRTQSGMTVGTPHYMAPEQARGDKDVDGRADVYSLGATFFHLVTGCAPYAGQTAVEIVSQHVLSPVPDPRDIRQGIPDEVSFVIRRMMAKNPAERYPDCGALREDLERIDTGRLPRGMPRPAPRPPATAVTIPLAPLPAAPPPPTPPRSASRIVFKVLVLLVLLAALAVVLDRQEIVRLPVSVPLPAEVEAWLGWGPSPDAEPGAKPPGGGRPKSAK